MIDSITGWVKARINKKENSFKGLLGIIKKMCYWIIILISFIIPVCFKELGKIINIDLSITIYLGWFVLASLIINECRSIIENLIEAGCNVPYILIKGLEIASETIEKVSKENE